MRRNAEQHTKTFARRLRKEMPAAERILRFKLRGLRRLGYLVRHQHCVGKYIADFACLSERVVIEVDGWSHSESETADATRQSTLENEGWLVLRFSNQEALRDPTAVADDVLRHLEARRHANSPPEDREPPRVSLIPTSEEREPPG